MECIRFLVKPPEEDSRRKNSAMTGDAIQELWNYCNILRVTALHIRTTSSAYRSALPKSLPPN
jgi:hypothetical protein